MTWLRVSGFGRDESGGGTVWGFFWFVLMVGLTGTAVDTTDGFRNKTMLQATADAAALAASIDLPDEALARSAALTYAELNMPAERYGTVLRPEDVEFGVWDPEARAFDLGQTPANAVRVNVHRSKDNGNALGVNFLRIIGVSAWDDIAASATAQRFQMGCLGDGLLSRQWVDISSNNSFIQNICIHGEQGVAMQQNNYYEEGVIVSMPDPNTMLQLPSSGFESNVGLAEALRAQSLHLPMIDDLPEIMAKLKDPSLDVDDPAVIPDYIDTSKPVIAVGRNYDFSSVAYTGDDDDPALGRIYHVQCADQSSVDIEGNLTYKDIVIVADCRIHVRADASFINVVLASTATGNGSEPRAMQNIDFASNVNLGLFDDCTEGGGVRVYSSASLHFASTTTIHGLQAVAAGEVELGARDLGIHGISVQAGMDIVLTSNNEFGLCSGGSDTVITHSSYRLVK